MDAGWGRADTKPYREEVKDVPGAILIHNVLHPSECEELLQFSEAMGYTEDAPVNLGRNVRHNDNCVWVAHQKLNEQLFERAKPFLPKKVLHAMHAYSSDKLLGSLIQLVADVKLRMLAGGIWAASRIKHAMALVSLQSWRCL